MTRFAIRDIPWARQIFTDVFLAALFDGEQLGAARVHGRHVRIASKMEPQMRQSSRSPLDWASLYTKAPVMHPDAIATGFGTEAVLRLWRIAIFRTGFPSVLD
jgi:hypothetical protein